MANLASRLDQALRAAGLAILGVTIPDAGTRSSWRVQPASLQPTAQPTIDTFNPDDPAVVDAELDAQIKGTLDQERLISAVVWSILDTYAEFKPATIAKYNAARTKIISAYKAQPWKP